MKYRVFYHEGSKIIDSKLERKIMMAESLEKIDERYCRHHEQHNKTMNKEVFRVVFVEDKISQFDVMQTRPIS